jgi:hypothetical protein
VEFDIPPHDEAAFVDRMRRTMKTNFFALALLLLLAVLPGCAATYKERINQQLWEREMRLMEDCNYRLKWQIEDMQHALDEANAQIQTLSKETSTLRDRGSSSGPDLTLPPALRSPGGGGTGRDSEAPMLPPAPGSTDVQPGREFIPGRSAPPKSSGAFLPTPSQRENNVSKASFTSTTNQGSRSGDRLDPDVNVERIVLNPALTGALDAQDQSSSRVLSVAVEQRDANDSRVLAPGDVTIVVVDPALEGRAARIARWDFESDDLAEHVRRNRDGGSLQFELPWPAQPQHNDLRVFVRFTTYDGRRLEANLPIDVPLGDFGFLDHGWRKSTQPVTAKPTADSPKSATSESASSANRRSVYEVDEESAEPQTAEDRRHDAARRPAWSPNR